MMMGKQEGTMRTPPVIHRASLILVLVMCARNVCCFDTCTKINACSCQSEDGIIDLSPLDSKDPNNPRFKDIPPLAVGYYSISIPTTRVRHLPKGIASTRRTSIINLECAPDIEWDFTPPSGDPYLSPYIFTLATKYACPSGGTGGGGLSTGSILCIVLLVLVIVYVVGGMVFMNVARGAKGVEMVPNLDFWKELPSLIKDGGKFVFTGCKSKIGYEEM